MMQELDALISEFSHERQRPRAADALTTLRKVSSMVKPIMRQRGWRVGTLAEIYPDQRNLLGLNYNRGQKICLRLRYPSDDSQFLPIEEVIDTMLHELCHIVHGPHDQHFHALWDQLRDEYEALLRKGYTGEGFVGKGQRLGGRGGFSLEEARRQARAVAQQRRQQMSGPSAGSGKRLGGRAPGRGEDIRSVISSAADRRRAISSGCGSTIGTEQSRSIVEQASRNGFRTKAEEDEANDRAIMQAYMELIQEEEQERLGAAYVPATASNPAGSRTGSNLSASGTNPGSTLPPPPPVPLASKPASTASSSAASSGLDGWTCEICTLFNRPNHLCCDACGAEKPSSFATSALATSDEPVAARTHRRPASTVRSAGASRSRASRTDGRRVLKPRSNQEVVDRIYAASEAQKLKPVGWKCSCGNFMEARWWTCASCGRMKESSA